MTLPLPPITSVRDAADIAAAVTAALASGHITPGEAVEVGKVIDVFVRAYWTAELDERVERIEQLSDAELLRIIGAADMNSITPRLSLSQSR